MDPVTGAIGSLLPKLGELLGDKLKKSVREDVVFLKETLAGIQCDLRDVEGVPMDQLNVQTKEWTRQARNLSYDIEHVVDKLRARQLRAANPPAADPNEFIAKVRFKVAIDKAFRQFAADIRGFRHPIKELNEKRGTFAVPRRTMAAGELDGQVDELVGLDDPMEKLIKILTEEESTSNRQLKIASILGSAGVGKTTLANQVYQRLNPRFECTAWVTVSTKPDIKNVLWNMLCQISLQDDAKFGSINVEETIGKIREALKDKRYFIVVDDIWDIKARETIKSALIENCNGSAVLMSSRKVSVARCTGVMIYRLRPLSKISSKRLFYNRLFGSSYNYPPELEHISEKILEKCIGVPLAIINATNLLAGKTKEDWHTVLESNYLEDSCGMRSRNHSYTGVPRYLKSCLLYLSMFQKGYEISVDRVVWGWIAEGFIPEHARMTRQQLGQEYLSELIGRNFIELVEVDAGGKALSCRVNNMGHNLIVSLLAEENSVTILDGRQGRPLPETIYRLSIQGNSPMPQVRLSNVRSLVVSGDTNLLFEETGGANLLSKFENLHVLDLGGCDYLQNEHLHGIGGLLLLRYLVMGGNCITDIPKEIGCLVFLQTLDLRACSAKELPESIVQARKLKCLLVNKYMKIPDGIVKMKALEELGDINISKPELLEELCHLTNLRVLRIVIWSWDDSYGDALLGYLGSLVTSRQNIHSLSILTCCSLHFLDKLDAEHAPLRLQKLEIRHSTFLTLPRWISSLQNLSSLSIEVNKLSQGMIIMLGQLENLLVLSLTSKHAPEGNFTDGFANLTSFHFVSNAMGKIFGPGAMLKLKRLDLSFQASRTKDVFQGFDFGLENLSSVEHVRVEIICFNASIRVVEDAEDAITRAVYGRGRSRGANLGIKRVQEEDMLENEKEEEVDMIDSEKEDEDMVENAEEGVIKQEEEKETKKMKKMRKIRVATKKFHQKEKGVTRKYKIVSLHLRSQTLTLQTL